MPKYEKTQTGNPHEITIKQHVFPRRAIARFVDGTGRVRVQRLGHAGVLGLVPEDVLFCARRVWDQATETTRSHRIEIAFSAIADQLVAGALQTLTPSMNDAVSEFYSLWRHRQFLRLSPMPDVQANMVDTSPRLTQDQEEILETKGVLFFRGKVMPGRLLSGMQLMRNMDAHMATLWNARWGVVRAVGAQFLVPDGPGELCAVPVGPSVILLKDVPDYDVDPLMVARINRFLVDKASGYYFARDLEHAPILRRTIPIDDQSE